MSDTYFLARNEEETKRLDTQHKLWTSANGFLIHPSIAARLPARPRIADIGCGTGVWLRDVSAQHPDAQLDGYDISPAQFPPASTHPSNIHLAVANVKEPFPAELHGQYDLVHLRLLIAAFDKEDWAPAAAHVAQLLKPGGAVQWGELDAASAKALKGLPESTFEGATALVGAFTGPKFTMGRLSQGWDLLPAIFKDLGFKDVATHVVATDRVLENRLAGTLNAYTIIVNWARVLADKGVEGFWSKDELEPVIVRFKADVDSGAYVRYDFDSVIGFK